MNKLLTAAALAAFATVGTANAADLPMKAAPMGPIAAPTYGWTGFYLNAGFGYGMWTADTTTIFPTGPLAGTCILCVTQTQGGRGWLGTVGGGFDWQFSDRIVAGAFLDTDFSRIRGTIQDQGPFFAGRITETWSWAAGGRIGWLVTPQILSYFNGGFTQTHFDGAAMQDTFTGITTPFVTPAFTKSGFFIGGGMEAMFAPGWFWRSEYRYADYGTVNLSDTAPGGPVVVVPGVGAFANPQSTITFHPIVQTIRSEIVYKFNWGPVVAKY